MRNNTGGEIKSNEGNAVKKHKAPVYGLVHGYAGRFSGPTRVCTYRTDRRVNVGILKI